MVVPAEQRAPSRRSRFVLPLAGLAISLALLAALLVGFAAPDSPAGSPLIGARAPEFDLPTTDGGTRSLASLRGQVVIVNFWASWCVPCREEAPLLDETAREFGDRGLRVLGVLYQDDPAAARAFEETYGLTYESVVDAAGRTAIDYGVFAIPESFLVDREGVIRERQIGPYSRAQVDRLIAQYLS